MAAQTQGYSGKPLFQKLGMMPGLHCMPIDPPDHYMDLIAGSDGILLVTPPAQADIVHLFCADRTALEAGIEPALGQVAPKGMLWVSWPKKSSPLFVDLTEDVLREVILPLGWVDVKVCAVDADWSGLKFLRRKTGTPRTK